MLSCFCGNISGGIILTIMTFFLVGENTEASCVIRPYFCCIGLSVSFAPLLFKSIKGQLVVESEAFAKVQVKNYWLAVLMGAMVLLDLLLLTTSLYAGNAGGTRPVTVTELTSNGAYAAMTYCGYYRNTSFAAVMIAYKAFTIVLACYALSKRATFLMPLEAAKYLW